MVQEGHVRLDLSCYMPFGNVEYFILYCRLINEGDEYDYKYIANC